MFSRCCCSCVNQPVVNIQVSPAISSDIGGSIEVNAPTVEHISWENEDESEALLTLEKNRRRAINVAAGNYVVSMHTGNNALKQLVHVPELRFPTIVSYTVVHATSDTARNGSVSALLRYFPDECAYLWTNGVVTAHATLHNVPPGKYMVSPIDLEGREIPYVHACSVAVVRCRPN